MFKDFFNIAGSKSLRLFIKKYDSEIVSYKWHTDRVKSIFTVKFKDGSEGSVSF